MAITASAKKAQRNSLRKRLFNVRRNNAVYAATKELKKLVAGKKIKEAAALLSKAYKAIDKAAKLNTFHRNTAARKKSRLAALFRKVQG